MKYLITFLLISLYSFAGEGKSPYAKKTSVRSTRYEEKIHVLNIRMNVAGKIPSPAILVAIILKHRIGRRRLRFISYLYEAQKKKLSAGPFHIELPKHLRTGDWLYFGHHLFIYDNKGLLVVEQKSKSLKLFGSKMHIIWEWSSNGDEDYTVFSKLVRKVKVLELNKKEK